MNVRDIVAGAFQLVGRPDVAAVVSRGTTSTTTQIVEVMLYCFNAVEYELARNYFPLVYSEQIAAKSGKIYFSDFKYSPVKIVSVKSGGNPLKYGYQPQYIEVNASSAEVEYWYVPQKKLINGTSEYDGTEVGEILIAYGAAAEFCLINGECSAAEMWESKYREAIDKAALTRKRSNAIPPRRWV